MALLSDPNPTQATVDRVKILFMERFPDPYPEEEVWIYPWSQFQVLSVPVLPAPAKLATAELATPAPVQTTSATVELAIAESAPTEHELIPALQFLSQPVTAELAIAESAPAEQEPILALRFLFQSDTAESAPTEQEPVPALQFLSQPATAEPATPAPVQTTPATAELAIAESAPAEQEPVPVLRFLSPPATAELAIAESAPAEQEPVPALQFLSQSLADFPTEKDADKRASMMDKIISVLQKDGMHPGWMDLYTVIEWIYWMDLYALLFLCTAVSSGTIIKIYAAGIT